MVNFVVLIGYQPGSIVGLTRQILRSVKINNTVVNYKTTTRN